MKNWRFEYNLSKITRRVAAIKSLRFVLFIYSQVPLQPGQIYQDIILNTAMTAADLKLATDIPYIALAGELWCVCCEDIGENWPRYNGTAWNLFYSPLIVWKLLSSASSKDSNGTPNISATGWRTDRWINTVRPEQNGRHFADDLLNAFSWKTTSILW